VLLTQSHAVWLSRGHDRDHELPCKPCSAQYTEDECQLQPARDSTNHKDVLCSSTASDSPTIPAWTGSPKAAPLAPWLNMLHAPVNAAVTTPLSWTARGSLEKGGFRKVRFAVTSMKLSVLTITVGADNVSLMGQLGV